MTESAGVTKEKRKKKKKALVIDTSVASCQIIQETNLMQQKYAVQEMSSVSADTRTATLNFSNNTWLGLAWSEMD